uniref:Uncharacterized protein n=1 Tax=Fundidesulfovibrio putealis TaxID=270496 RepID=A0A7C4EMR4_9BACT
MTGSRNRMAACLLLAALAAGLGGCGASARYESPGKSQNQMQQDQAECEWEASKATGNLANASDRKDRLAEMLDQCMRAKGYSVR